MVEYYFRFLEVYDGGYTDVTYFYVLFKFT